MKKLYLCLAVIFLILPQLAEASRIYYVTENGIIYQINQTTGEKKPLHIYGINWFGFETPDHVVYGLDYRNWREILLEVKKLGFNAIRLPFCSETIHGAKPNPQKINYALNPDLENLTSLEIMEKIIAEAEKLHIYILLDYHRIGCTEIEPLWHTKEYPEEKYISDWLFLAKKFGRYPNIIGADIKNEPHGKASWGTGNEKTDFRLFVERLGEKILKVAPQWLIFIEGTQNTHVPQVDAIINKNRWWAFWGENLMGVKDYPVRLPKGKIVYSPHVYGPSVYMMNYFKAPDFPKNMPIIWETHFGYLKQLNYTLVIGEWGGRYKGIDKIWQDSFSRWLIKNRIYDFFYWCLNPESEDTGGIFLDDWKTVNWEKMRVIYRIIKASNPEFREPIYIILKSNATTSVLRKNERVKIYWYTDGNIISSNFAHSKEGEIVVALNTSTSFYIEAEKNNETLKKKLQFYVIESNKTISSTNKNTSLKTIVGLIILWMALGVFYIKLRNK